MIPKVKTFSDGSRAIELYGEIGCERDRISGAEFNAVLQVNKIDQCPGWTILFDSRGGRISELRKIEKAIGDMPLQPSAVIVGRCASAAVDILMRCQPRHCLRGSALMIHQSRIGNTELNDSAVQAEQLAKGTRAWRHHPGATREELAAFIVFETWFNHDEMIEFGFCHRIIDPTEDLPLRTKTNLDNYLMFRPHEVKKSMAKHWASKAATAPEPNERPRKNDLFIGSTEVRFL